MFTTRLSPLSKPPRVPLSRLESSSSTPRRSRLRLLLFPGRRRAKKKKKNTTRQSSPRRIKRSSKRGFCRLSGDVYISPTTTTKNRFLSTPKKREKKRKGRRKGRTSDPMYPRVVTTAFAFSRQNVFHFVFRVAPRDTHHRNARARARARARAHTKTHAPARERDHVVVVVRRREY